MPLASAANTTALETKKMTHDDSRGVTPPRQFQQRGHGLATARSRQRGSPIIDKEPAFGRYIRRPDIANRSQLVSQLANPAIALQLLYL